MRLFFAVDLPEALSEAFTAVQRSFQEAEGLRFTDPSQAHVTLKFLGDIAEDRLPEVEAAAEEAVENADVDPFEVEVGGLGVFPDEEYVSVLWTGVRDGGDELARLYEALEDEMTGLGFDAETNSFTPHFTLARMDDARGKNLVLRRVDECDPTVGRFEASQVRLKSSTLNRNGPAYETVARFDL